MVNFGGEADLGWLEWIIRGKLDDQKEDTAAVRRVSWSHDGCLPMIKVIPNWASTAGAGWIPTKIL